MQYSYAATFALLVSVAAYGQPPARPAPSLALDPVPFDDVSELLRVLRRSGRLTLNACNLGFGLWDDSENRDRPFLLVLLSGRPVTQRGLTCSGA